jgi:hypothetical protein
MQQLLSSKRLELSRLYFAFNSVMDNLQQEQLNVIEWSDICVLSRPASLPGRRTKYVGSPA